MRTPGKKVGSCTYIHHQYFPFYPPLPLKNFNKAVKKLPRSFLGLFTIIKYDSKTGNISFINSPDWTVSPEPVVGDIYTVTPKGEVKFRKFNQNSPQIYHHKWMFVADDYKGFDVEASKKRSEAWEKLKPNKSKIGYKKYWEAEVVPHIKESK